MKTTRKRIGALLALGLAALLAAPQGAFASTSAGMPWESPLQRIGASLSGPVAGVISLIALVVCGMALIFGGEIGEFTKRLLYVVMVIAVLVGAATLLTTLFGSTGAVF